MQLETLSKEQVIKAYEQKHKIKISNERDYCFVPIAELEGIYAIGSFVNDWGCMGDEIAVGKTIGKWQDLMPEALHLLGWEDEKKQADLALSWVKNLMLVWENPLNSKSDDFDKEGVSFQKPSVEKVGNNWLVQLWVQEPVGMLPKASFYYLQVTISPEAKVIEQKSLNSFSHSYR